MDSRFSRSPLLASQVGASREGKTERQARDSPKAAIESAQPRAARDAGVASLADALR
jgi:hypothetical protein